MADLLLEVCLELKIRMNWSECNRSQSMLSIPTQVKGLFLRF